MNWIKKHKIISAIIAAVIILIAIIAAALVFQGGNDEQPAAPSTSQVTEQAVTQAPAPAPASEEIEENTIPQPAPQASKVSAFRTASWSTITVLKKAGDVNVMIVVEGTANLTEEQVYSESELWEALALPLIGLENTHFNGTVSATRDADGYTILVKLHDRLSDWTPALSSATFPVEGNGGVLIFQEMTFNKTVGRKEAVAALASTVGFNARTINYAGNSVMVIR